METMETKDLHPNTKLLLSYFAAHAELPAEVRAKLVPFAELAASIAVAIDGPEATVCMRKLLEAQDCAVRALTMK